MLCYCCLEVLVKNFLLIPFYVVLACCSWVVASEAIQEQSKTVVVRPQPSLTSQWADLSTTYTRIIPLGHWCTTKAEINRFFNPDAPMEKTKAGHADLFDWLFINDYDLLATALNKGLTDFFEFEDFNWNKFGGINKKYNMNWNHLFVCGHNTFEGSVPESNILEAFPGMKAKINYLRSKFLDAASHKTLYVISHPQKISSAALLNVRNALVNVRNGDTSFSILYIPSGGASPDVSTIGDNIFVREAKFLGEKAVWNYADHQRWHEILSEFKFSDDIWQ